MKVMEIDTATSSLEEYARKVKKQPIIVTKNGRPFAALVALKNADMETIELSTNPRFMDLIDRSRERHKTQGGMTRNEVSRSLGLNRPKGRK
jgi:prevent-host-death family protein